MVGHPRHGDGGNAGNIHKHQAGTDEILLDLFLAETGLIGEVGKSPVAAVVRRCRFVAHVERFWSKGQGV